MSCPARREVGLGCVTEGYANGLGWGARLPPLPWIRLLPRGGRLEFKFVFFSRCPHVWDTAFPE